MVRVIGPAFGGNGIVFVKPSVFAGGDRPGKRGIELGYKIIGFSAEIETGRWPQ